MKRKEWNDKKLNTLRILVQMGKSADEIAMILSENATSIYNICKKHKISLSAKFQWSDEKIAEFTELAKTMTQGELAAHYKKSRQNIKYHCKKHNITPKKYVRKTPITPSEQAQSKRRKENKKIIKNNLIHKLWDERKSI